MRRLLVIGACIAGLALMASVTGPGWSQKPPKTCSEAYSACASQTGLPKECEVERQWCIKSGTFADPKTKATTSGLAKK
jgi:hypothetical protein